MINKDDIIWAMKESDGLYADMESTNPAEFMAGLLLDKLEKTEK